MKTYLARNTLTGRFYIGSTCDFESRKRKHLNSRENYPFQTDLRENAEAFEWEVFEDDSEGRELEQALLDMWFGKEQCYNLNPIAECGPSAQGKTWYVNKRLGQEKISLEHPGSGWEKGRKNVSPETREKLSESHKGPRSYWYGRTGELSQSHGKRQWKNESLGQQRLCQDCPGEGWELGFLEANKQKLRKPKRKKSK